VLRTGSRRLVLVVFLLVLAVAGWWILSARRFMEERVPPGATLVEAGFITRREDARMSVVKVLELVGESPASWQEAARNAVQEAARTVDHITGMEVVNWTAEVSNGDIRQYRANVKVAFVVDNSRRQARPTA